LLSLAGLVAPAAVLAAPSAQASEVTIASTGLRPGEIKHVWLIILENKSYDATTRTTSRTWTAPPTAWSTT